MRIPIEDVQKQVEAETEQSVSGTPTWHEGAWIKAGSGTAHVYALASIDSGGESSGYRYYGYNQYTIKRQGYTDRIDSISPTSGSGNGYRWTASFSGTEINFNVYSNTKGQNISADITYTWSTKNSSFYIGTTKTIDLGDDKFVTAVSVVSKSPSGATVTPTKTEHGASVYLYQSSSSTITATIKLEYYYYETVKEAKVKHNGTIYKHIKYNGEIIV